MTDVPDLDLDRLAELYAEWQRWCEIRRNETADQRWHRGADVLVSMQTAKEAFLAELDLPELIRLAKRAGELEEHWHLGVSLKLCNDLRAKIAVLEAELAKWKPLTPEEAQKALDEAEAMPISEERTAS